MIWNWQQKNWPELQYDCSALGELESWFLRQSGVLQGTLKHGDRFQLGTHIFQYVLEACEAAPQTYTVDE